MSTKPAEPAASEREQPLVSVFRAIQRDAVPAERLFGVSGWCGEIDGKPALTLSYHGGATLAWFDGEWFRSQPFYSLQRLHQSLGIESH